MAKAKEQQPNLFGPEPPPWEEDDAAEQWLATVVVVDGPPQPLTYLVPDALREQVTPGVRVRAPLGTRQITGYCVAVETQPAGAKREFRLRPLAAVIDAEPLLNRRLLALTQWMSEYYLCGWADAIEAAVPKGVRVQAGTRAATFLSVPESTRRRWEELKLSPKQRHALQVLADAPYPLTPVELAERAGCSSAPIQTLRKQKLVSEEVRRVYQGAERQLEAETGPRQAGEQLNSAQRAALDTILAGIAAGRATTTLMHGVTGSGKTEVYIRAIEEVIQHGKQAIVLVPEISLTPQTRHRFRSRFDRVAVLHSHLSGPERFWHWQRIASGEVQVVVGARSAVFAPTKRLGLIVLDEEHDSSFKQDTPAPRYHAREVAMWRARDEQAALVLGSATPSLESWQRAASGHYRLVSMPDRVLNLPMPDVGVIDLRDRDEGRSRGAIGRVLQRSMEQALRDEGQVILLLNRRGYSTSIQCTACGETVTCPDCDISLTHHLEERKARCHYCDFERDPPMTCPACGFAGIRYSGLGTQKLELEVRGKFPGHTCLRMDSDTMRKHGSHEEALAKFREGQAQILLGTQMIAKGLDFPNVTLVGVINADTALHFPDFRAAERTFQLVTQVAGRTGRGAKGGRVLVQTFSPDHPAIMAAQRHDYEAFVRYELPQRRQFGYPPFSAMARLIVRGPSETHTSEFAAAIAERLRACETQGVETRVLGPAAAPLPKLQGRYRFHILVTCADRSLLRQIVSSAHELPLPKDVQFAIDIDPLSML
ncbi:MAG: primosomal protein N' [Planctomycetales bacterium]|nr:primosomal protein N' [Planctomycetales bacterium]